MSEPAPTVSQSTPPWWGEFDLPLQATRAWHIGSFDLHLTRTEHEIGASWWRSGEYASTELVVNAPASSPAPATATLERFGYRQPPARMRILPALPDRPLIVTPIHPFRLPPKEEATLFVSVPLWLQLSATGDVVLFEEPLHRLSDTWFGPNTRIGELCYASRSSARLSLSNLPALAQRAVSAVRIRNLATTVLELERLSLPAPHLSLYAGTNGHLWTEAVSLEREADGDFAALELSSAPPKAAGAAQRVSDSRERPERRTPFRSFGRLLRRGGLHG